MSFSCTVSSPREVTSATPVPAPPARPRLAGLDAARGLALLGMIVVNVGPVGSESLAQRLYVLPFGRASILFVVVAGLGMGYLLRSRTERERWSTVTWRAALLFAGGIALQGLTDRVNVILPTYAALFLLAPMLWRLSTRALVVLATALLVAGPSWIVMHRTAERRDHWLEPITVGTAPEGALHSLLISGPYPLASWTVPFVVGLAVARIDLSATHVLRQLMIGGGVAAVAAAVLAQVSISLLGPAAERGPLRLLTGAAHGQMPLWLVSATGGALFTIAVCTVVGRRDARILHLPAACGRLALTLYVLHVVVLAAVKPAHGFTMGQGMLVSAALIAVVVGAATLWAGTGRHGPLEHLLRRTWLRPGLRSRSATRTTMEEAATR
jgi:uncharacterized membrane protein YeiB